MICKINLTKDGVERLFQWSIQMMAATAAAVFSLDQNTDVVFFVEFHTSSDQPLTIIPLPSLSIYM